MLKYRRAKVQTSIFGLSGYVGLKYSLVKVIKIVNEFLFTVKVHHETPQSVFYFIYC